MAKEYLQKKAYDLLRNKILNCELEPGQIINEADLISEIGASRTPIHNAILSLATENLVTVIPKKGIIINGITLKNMVEVLDARLIIEPELILRYGYLFEKQYLSDYITRCQNAESISDKILFDEELHAKLYSLCRNQCLKDFLNNLEGQNHRNRRWRSNESRVDASISEHIAIAKSLFDGDYELASSSMRQHLNNARNYAMEKYV